MGLLGGAVMATVVLDISFFQFARQLSDAVTPWTFWVGVIKAPLFAFIIGMVGCYEGLQVSRSAESVGRQTTRAVVEAIFLVIVLDALLRSEEHTSELQSLMRISYAVFCLK